MQEAVLVWWLTWKFDFTDQAGVVHCNPTSKHGPVSHQQEIPPQVQLAVKENNPPSNVLYKDIGPPKVEGEVEGQQGTRVLSEIVGAAGPVAVTAEAVACEIAARCGTEKKN